MLWYRLIGNWLYVGDVCIELLVASCETYL